MATKYPASVSITSLDGTNGFTFTVQTSTFGYTTLPIASAGDTNGDGFDDILIGWTNQFLREGDRTIGGASVVFGGRGAFPTGLTPSSLNGKNGFTVIPPRYVEDFGSVVAPLGDVNGDGIDDFILGSSEYIPWHGAAAVVFGTKAGVPAKIDAGKLNGSNGFVIGSAQDNDDSANINFSLGNTVASAGDINGDGYDDIIVGVPRGPHVPRDPYSYNDGSAVILFGKKAGFPSYFDVPDLNGTNGFRVIGAKKAETGSEVASLGDINGDGFDDLWIGGRYDVDGHVVFGRKGGFGTTLDLTKLNGRDGFAIAASSVVSVGDLNGDGIDDFAIKGSEITVVFGRKAGFGAKLDVDGLDGTDGFVIEGGSFPFLSRSAVSTGDVNGDGIDDLVFASGTYPDRSSGSDQTYYESAGLGAFVVYGKKGTFLPSIGFSDFDGATGFKITGLDEGISAFFEPSVSASGDINGDGVDDIVVSRGITSDPPKDPIPVHVIYGGSSFIGVTRNGTAIGETLAGTKNGDVLNGLQGNDRLVGGAGDDRLDGGSGVDRLEGGIGDDTFLVDAAADTVIEAAGAGKDTVITTTSYALTAGQEIEVLRTADRLGRSNLNLTGNEKDNRVFGNAGANVLSGGAGGQDSLIGGGGNDVYAIATNFQYALENIGEGNDAVVASVSFTLSFDSEIETLQLATRTGKANLNLTGNEFAQVIRGNGGGNVLDGGISFGDRNDDDSLYGRGGDDILVVRRGGDKAYELAGEGKDAVVTYVSYALTAGQEIETLRLHSNARVKDLDLTGNEFANTLVGFDGKNVLDGGLGADVLTGRKGADTFVFSTKLGGGNVDHITDFAPEDTIRLSKSVFTALGTGPLAESAFKVIGPAGADADDRILYKQATGEVFYDADGSGSAAATLFAVLDNRATLTAGDVLIA